MSYHYVMDARIEKVLNHIEGHLSDDLSLSTMAKMACMSESQFHRVFKTSTVFTPFKFIEKLRINFAYQKLIKAPQSIQLLSERCGYQDYETFSRTFKRFYSISPHDLAAITNQIKGTLETVDDIYMTAMEEPDKSALESK